MTTMNQITMKVRNLIVWLRRKARRINKSEKITVRRKTSIFNIAYTFDTDRLRQTWIAITACKSFNSSDKYKHLSFQCLMFVFLLVIEVVKREVFAMSTAFAIQKNAKFNELDALALMNARKVPACVFVSILSVIPTYDLFPLCLIIVIKK